jgi:hypothetical protein
MEQFFKTPYNIIRNKEYSKWSGTAEFRVWQYLVSYIVRKPNGNNLTKFLYEKYHVNGMLVSRWNQKDIAINIGLRSAGHVSDLLSSMNNKGIIVKHTEYWNGKLLCVYEFGLYNKNTNKETYHAFNYFKKKNGEKTLKKLSVVSECPNSVYPNL